MRRYLNPRLPFPTRRYCCTLRPDELQSLATYQLFHQRLANSKQAVLTRPSFEALCVSCGIQPSDTFIREMHDAGTIVDLGDSFFIKPTVLLTQAGHLVKEPFEPLVQTHIKLQTLVNEKSQLDAEVQKACDRAASTRRFMWGGAMAYAGTQLAVISRLTYFDLDWDVMEPVTYFLGTGTALIFYGWMLYFRQEHSYEECDKRLVNAAVRRILVKQQFDFARYRTLTEDINATKKAIREAEEWYSKH